MQANPNKFQVLAVGKKTYEKHPTINIQYFELTCEDSVKLLGIEIDYQLNFDTHIHVSTICRKASQQLTIIKCLGPYLNRLNKLTIFHTFILSNFNFCPLAWHFCTEKNSKKIEKVQERALRFVYEDYNSSYDNLLTKAKVERLWNFPLFRISYIALVPLSASALIACTKSGSLRFSQFSGC
jgi:hypothetical protein